MAAKKKGRRAEYRANVQVDIEQVRAPLAMWPGVIRKHFKKHAFDPNTAKGWYRWRMGMGKWYSILYLPEDKAAIIQLGPDSVALVEDVSGVVEALQVYVKAADGG